MLWGITDGSAGMQNQVHGVLEALGQPYVLKICRRKKPWVWLPVWCNRGALSQLEAGGDALAPPWPDAIITSGRRSAALALAIRRASGGSAKLIHLTDSRACRGQFSLIVAMAHDKARGSNVIHTQMALHRITPEKLCAAAEAWVPRFAHLPRPYIAVLIGGATHRCRLTREAMQQVIARLQEVRAGTQGSLLVTPSRRTGGENVALLHTGLRGDDIFLYGLGGENPYFGMLALADHVIVTDDSVNMVSEALATGKPVHILSLPGHTGTKPAHFAQRMIEAGYARELKLPLANWHYTPPDEMQRVVEAIRALLPSPF